MSCFGPDRAPSLAVVSTATARRRSQRATIGIRVSNIQSHSKPLWQLRRPGPMTRSTCSGFSMP
jgi:hypothetical protein